MTKFRIVFAALAFATLLVSGIGAPAHAGDGSPDISKPGYSNDTRYGN
jgi:hypothetical protein